MKRWICFFALLQLLAGSVGAATEDSQIFTVLAKGMSCGGCVKKVEQNLKALREEVRGVVITVEKNKATVDYSKTQLKAIEKSQLRSRVEEAIKAAGFEIVPS